MTYDEIDEFIVREEHKLRKKFYRMEFGLAYLLNPAKGMEPFHRQKNIWLWETALEKIFGKQLSPQTRNLWMKVRNIYILDAAGELLPLRQAIQLLDIYRRLQDQLSVVEARSPNMRPPRAQLRDGQSARLESGETPEIAARAGGFVSPEAIRDEIRSSCARLEAILIGVHTAAQERRRHTPGSPRARADYGAPASDEAQSLAAIEHQIEREIEFYRWLEHAKEAHLQ